MRVKCVVILELELGQDVGIPHVMPPDTTLKPAGDVEIRNPEVSALKKETSQTSPTKLLKSVKAKAPRAVRHQETTEQRHPLAEPLKFSSTSQRATKQRVLKAGRLPRLPARRGAGEKSSLTFNKLVSAETPISVQQALKMYSISADQHGDLPSPRELSLEMRSNLATKVIRGKQATFTDKFSENLPRKGHRALIFVGNPKLDM
eukprot:750113-Hanusia_phi.AAC.5